MIRTLLPVLCILSFSIGCAIPGAPSGVDGLELLPRLTDDCTDDACTDPVPPDECEGWLKSGDGAYEGCKLDCPRGGPNGPVAVLFECNEVHVTSCKDLSNVVVGFEDGEHYKYDGLKGKYGTFGGGDRPIATVWVKAGNNASGDGPGYGERFDSSADCDDGAGGAGGDGGAGGAAGTGGYAGAGGMGGSAGAAGGGGDGGAGGATCDPYECKHECQRDFYACKSYCYTDYEACIHECSAIYAGCKESCEDECDDECSPDDPPESHCKCEPTLECPYGGSVGEIDVEFECSAVHVSSCKDISNVVLEFDDGDHRKFDGLSGQCATLGVGDRIVSGVWVKAGNNKSGDGPGYGERFDSDQDCDGTGGDGGSGGAGGSGAGGGSGGSGGIVVH